MAGASNAVVETDNVMVMGKLIGGGKLECDISALVDTRLLIQANSARVGPDAESCIRVVGFPSKFRRAVPALQSGAR
jgi:hypothetical protein